MTDNHATIMNFDNLLTFHLGEFGRYQKWMCFVLSLTGIPFAFANMEIVFLAGIPKFWCSPSDLKIAGNISLPILLNATMPWKENSDGEMVLDTCKRYDLDWDTLQSKDELVDYLSQAKDADNIIACKSWTYDTSQYKSTVVTKWNLVCDLEGLISLSQSVYMGGLMAGVFLLGLLSDRFGRRPLLLHLILVQIIIRVIIAFSPNFLSFTIFRFFLGMCTIGWYTTAFVMAVEMVGPSWRVTSSFLLMYSWAFGYMILAGLAWAISDWFILQLGLSIFLVPFLAFFFWLPESPRWLYAQGQYEEANSIAITIAKYNRVTLPDHFDIQVKEESIGKGNVKDLLRTSNVRKRSLNLFFNWFVNSLVYYGLSLNTSNLGGNDYVNFFISGAVEIPAYILCQYSIHTRLGRRLSLCGAMIIGGLALLFTIAVPKEITGSDTIIITLAMTGKLAISASFAIIYIYSAELFPTVIRNIGIGAASLHARVGGIIAPLIAQLARYDRYFPIAIFGISSLVAGLLALFLPETRNKSLPETTEDAEQFGRSSATSGKPKLLVNDTINNTSYEVSIAWISFESCV